MLLSTDNYLSWDLVQIYLWDPQGRSGRSGKVFKKGEGCCGIRQGTMLLSKKLYNGIYRYISGISGQIGLPLCFALVTHTPTPVHSKFQIPNSAAPLPLFETLARSARSAGRLYTLPSVFRSGNTHTHTRPQQIPNSKTNVTQVRHHEPSWLF